MKSIYRQLAVTIFSVLVGSAVANAETGFQSWSGQVEDANPSPIIHTPRSLEQVIAIVKKTTADKKKIRVSGARHSWNSVILSDSSVYISTVNLNKIGPIKNSGGQAFISVEPGVMLGKLSDQLFESGYSLGFAMPEFRGLTIGGLLATGSHGSSRKHVAVSTQLIKSLELVTADGSVRTLTKKDGDLFKAATVNLGALGVVTKVELILAPKFNLKVTSSVMDLQKTSLPDFLKSAPAEDFLFVMWFPRMEKAILESGVITNDVAEDGAENIMFGSNAGTLESDYAVAGILAKGRADASGAIEAAIEAKRYDGLVLKPRFVVDVGGFDVNKASVVGNSNKMLLARGDSITWPYKLSDYSFAFPVSDLEDVMKTIKAFAATNNYSFPNAGISMRFAKSDGGQSSLLSQFEDKDHANQMFVSAEFLEFRDYNLKGEAKGPRENLKYELLSLLVKKHGVKFHLGKNDDAVLKSEPSYAHSFDQYGRFLSVVNQLDPSGTFINDFVSQIVKTRMTP